MRNKVMILGCGRLGVSIANEASSKGENVIVVDKNPQKFDHLDEQYSGLTFVGDCALTSTLEEAGVMEASEVVIATGDDNVNLLLCHVCARVYKVPHIFARFGDPDKGLLIQGMPVKAIYPSQLSRSRYNSLKKGGEQ